MKKVVLMFIPAFIYGVVFTSCGLNSAVTKEDVVVVEMYEESEWWQPILQKHNIDPVGYNNFDNVFTMGMEENSINNGICTLKIATVLIKNSNKSYILIEADSVYHHIEEGVFDIVSGIAKVYEMDADLSKPTVSHLNVTRLLLPESSNY